MTPEKTIQELFNTLGQSFEIPSYQRAYSWGERQLNQLIEDLNSVSSEYYLGHFLFEKDSSGSNTLFVIDGQQRMTTIVIFFSVMYKTLKKMLEEADADTKKIKRLMVDLRQFYLYDDNRELQKFSTVENDNNFFSCEIIEDINENPHQIDTRSKKRIREAKETFEKLMEGKSLSELEHWKNLIEKAAITTYEVEKKIQATRIFAFQNDRGKALTNLEVLKSYFMLQVYLSGSSEQQIDKSIKYIESDIAEIYKTIESIDVNEDTVLNYYWRAFSGKGYDAENVVANVKKALNSSDDKLTWIKDNITKIKRAFEIVKDIENSADKYVIELRFMNNMALSYPFFIKHKFLQPNATVSELAKLLSNITFRYILRGGRAEIESRLNHFLKKLDKDTDIKNSIINPIVHELRHSGWWRYWSDREMEHHLRGGYIYYNRMRNFILWKYELSLYGMGYNPTVTYYDVIKKANIEHIAPQTPTKGKPTKYGYGIYKDKDTPRNGIESGEWLHCIGNLMILSQPHNSSVSNGPFPNKLASFEANGNLKQHKELLNFVSDKDNPVWDVDAIERRFEKIVKFAMDYWSLDKL